MIAIQIAHKEIYAKVVRLEDNVEFNNSNFANMVDAFHVAIEANL